MWNSGLQTPLEFCSAPLIPITTFALSQHRRNGEGACRPSLQHVAGPRLGVRSNCLSKQPTVFSDGVPVRELSWDDGPCCRQLPCPQSSQPPQSVEQSIPYQELSLLASGRRHHLASPILV